MQCTEDACEPGPTICVCFCVLRAAMVEQVRLADHTASASAPPLPIASKSLHADDAETSAKQSQLQSDAEHLSMPPASTPAPDPMPAPRASAVTPALDTSAPTASTVLSMAGEAAEAEGPCAPLKSLTPVGPPEATSLRHLTTGSSISLEGRPGGQLHQRHQGQQHMWQRQEHGQGMRGPPHPQLLAAGSSAALLSVSAMGGRSSSSTCLFSRDGEQELRPLSPSCASTGLCHIPGMAAALTTPPLDTELAAKLRKATRALTQGNVASTSGTHQLPLPPCRGTDRVEHPPSQLLAQQQAQAVHVQQPPSSSPRSASHASVQANPQSLVNGHEPECLDPQRQQQQADADGVRRLSADSSACALSR